ncbi:sulfide/dihydroorotate dehydrogenase-like FAD/NAD-binding protein [Clostridium hydrogenum]|uniref:sulfide/dihydroorotate dehydrogenase-like FAD/NAD-binding protein n=1 Tax=Clostridium hydrogenum TaxID=2855764 RepID=UPI001F4664B1|nr:sulfide/dihydroorotate dehydrogenase-like FAD/NAD-binding protein [Clostridium hydrogenum]
MDYEIIDCIDSGTEYCPCHLAETGDCILCSQLKGKTSCDCVNWKGVCIYQEYIWNGNKAKKERESYPCSIIDKKLVGNSLIIFTIFAKHKLVNDLLSPGSYVFLRNPTQDQYYDVPISIMEANQEENTLKFAIEIKGIKTKHLAELNEKDTILVRGPYWNGALGIKNINNCKDSSALIIARGIGEAPMIPVMKKLYSNGNKILLIIDKANYDEVFIQKYLKECNAEVYYCNMLSKGNLTYEFMTLLLECIKNKNINLIHISGADILINRVLTVIDDNLKVSCSNNAKMCCGEGICGACTVRYSGHKLKRLCKIQIDPRYLFKNRRYI